MGVFNIDYEVQDYDGDRASFRRFIPDSWALADVIEYAQAYAQRVDDVIDGILSRISFSVNVDLSGLAGNLVETASDVEEVAAFKFRTDVGTEVLVNVPGVNETLVAANSDELNQADPNVAAFITMMSAGVVVTGGTIIPCDIDEQDITNVVYARENFRASGRRR